MDNQLKIEKAFTLWVELTEVDPNSDYWSFKNYDIVQMNREIKESIKLDETLTTTILLLRYFTENFLSMREFSVKDILSEYELFQTYIQKSKELTDILNSEEVKNLVSHLKESTKNALHHYGVTQPEVFKLLDDSETLAFLRRDALKSIKTLDVYQFSHGDTNNNFKAKYFKDVLQFWNVNSLVNSLSKSPTSGISLCLIKDPTAVHSYFTFAIRNGGTITIVTDKPKTKHPLQKEMSRRPSRDLSKRMARHHFPYSLMDLRFDYRGDAFVREDLNSIVPYQVDATKLKEIKDLEPEEVVWIIMMFELLQNKFWKEQYKTNELSYTAEMLQLETPSTELCKNLSLPLGPSPIAPNLKVSDITTTKLLKEWEVKPVGHNQWLEERYKDLISDNVLNLMDIPSKLQLFINGDTMDTKNLRKLNHNELYLYEKDSLNSNLVELKPMDLTSFGTKEELLRDRRWHARYTKAKQIKFLANKEFKERSKELQTWYKEAIGNNLPHLLSAVAKKEFNTLEEISLEDSGFSIGKRETSMRNILSFVEYKTNFMEVHNAKVGASFRKLNSLNNPVCYLTGASAYFVALFKPSTPQALADLCGIEIKDLPDVLQHWFRHEPYSGNSILQRLDPLDWVIENPWMKQPLAVSIFISKKAYNDLRKKYNLPLDKFWLNNK